MGIILMNKFVAHLFKAYEPRKLHAALRTARDEVCEPDADLF